MDIVRQSTIKVLGFAPRGDYGTTDIVDGILIRITSDKEDAAPKDPSGDRCEGNIHKT
jgi:hypothetical protein